jgi:hypothetical protein
MVLVFLNVLFDALSVVCKRIRGKKGRKGSRAGAKRREEIEVVCAFVGVFVGLETAQTEEAAVRYAR